MNHKLYKALLNLGNSGLLQEQYLVSSSGRFGGKQKRAVCTPKANLALGPGGKYTISMNTQLRYTNYLIVSLLRYR